MSSISRDKVTVIALIVAAIAAAAKILTVFSEKKPASPAPKPPAPKPPAPKPTAPIPPPPPPPPGTGGPSTDPARTHTG